MNDAYLPPGNIKSVANGLKKLAHALDHVLFGQRVFSLLDANQVVDDLGCHQSKCMVRFSQHQFRPKQNTNTPKLNIPNIAGSLLTVSGEVSGECA